MTVLTKFSGCFHELKSDKKKSWKVFHSFETSCANDNQAIPYLQQPSLCDFIFTFLQTNGPFCRCLFLCVYFPSELQIPKSVRLTQE